MIRKTGVIIAFLLLLTQVGTAWAAVNFTEDVIEVDGYGAPSDQPHSRVQGVAMARLAARADAYRNLLAETEGVAVDADTTVQDLMTASDTIWLRVHGMVKGAHVVFEDAASTNGYRVTLQLRLHGEKNSLASAITVPWEKEPLPQPPDRRNGQTDALPLPVAGAYTGVIIDCRELALQPVMSPVIKDAGGQPVYGSKNLDSDYVVRYGMAGYSHAMATVSRSGSNPLRLKAIRLENHCNPILSEEDAGRLLAENQRSHFLEQGAVVFVRE